MNEPNGGSATAVDEDELARLVGAEIKGLREKLKLSTRQLALRAGISQPFLSQIERGVSMPSMVTTYRLAEALGVLPGALLPSPDTDLVSVVRNGEGRMLPVASRDDAARGRGLLMRPDTVLEVIEYVIAPGEFIEEWFELDGDLAVYVVSGQLDVEVAGAGTYRLHARDLIAHPASLRHRWLLVDDQPVHVLLTLAHPAQAARPARAAGSR